MSPERIRGLAYWSSGGGVEGRSGPLSLSTAVALLAFLGESAEACSGFDAAARRYCAEIAIELGQAIARAISWRGCSGPRLAPTKAKNSRDR